MATITDQTQPSELSNLIQIESPHLVRTVFAGLLVYFACHVMIRTLISEAMELDEAELMVLGQWLLPGYSEKPPLYVWMQVLFFKIFGVHIFALSILKNALLFSSYLFMYLSARRLGFSSTTSILTMLSFFFISEIVWESQRDLTHSVLVLTAGTGTLYCLINLLQRRTLWSYMACGLFLGLGALSKYNYFIFAFAILTSLVFTQNGRSVLKDPRLGISLLIMILFFLPQLDWFFQYRDSLNAGIRKMTGSGDRHAIFAMGRMLLSIVGYLGPLALIYGIVFPGVFKHFGRHLSPDIRGLALDKYFCLILVVLTALIFVFEMQGFKPRWMQPLLFVAPVYFFSNLKSEMILKKSVVRFISLSAVVAVLVLGLIPGRVMTASITGKLEEMNYPYPAIASKIRQLGFDKGIIVADRRVNAGNMRYHFPNTVVYDPKLIIPSHLIEKTRRPLMIVWDAVRSERLPGRLGRYLEETFDLEKPGTQAVTYVEAPYLYAAEHRARMGVVLIPE